MKRGFIEINYQALIKKIATQAMLVILLIQITSCSSKEIVSLPNVEDYELAEAAPKRELKVGLVPGPYMDMFCEAIQPVLEKMGYIVHIASYDNNKLPNISLGVSLGDARVDLNIFQHYKALNDYKFENDLALSAIAEVPTASMGIFSLQYESIGDIKKGATVSLPSDSAALSRALNLLEKAGIIRLDPTIDKTNSTEYDIISNPLNIELTPLEENELVESLHAYDLAVIDGSYAISSGFSNDDALYSEIMDDSYMTVIAVRTMDLGEQFVFDIIEALHSDEYRAVITDKNGRFAKYQKPRNFFESLD